MTMQLSLLFPFLFMTVFLSFFPQSLFFFFLFLCSVFIHYISFHSLITLAMLLFIESTVAKQVLLHVKPIQYMYVNI